MILRQINFCSVLRYKCITMIWTIHSVFHFRPYIFVPIILLVSLSWHVTFLLNSNDEVLFSKQSNWYSILIIFALFFNGGRRCLGHDRIVVGFTTTYAITTKVVSLFPTHGEVYSIQHYVIKVISKLQLFSR